MIKRIGIIGLGTVGEAVAHSLKKYGSLISRRVPLKIEIAGVCDRRRSKRKIARKYKIPFTTNADELINDPKIDIIVELIGGQEPAGTIIRHALSNGKDVVTANKALLAHQGRQIFALAEKKGCSVGFEASVCGAIPLIKSISEGLIACDIKKLYGILNGTTNYILYHMGRYRLDFFAALRQAQKKGFAERNPSFDIEGKDTLHKLCVLSYLCFGVWPDPDKVYTEGISRVTLQDILYAEDMGYRIKLLAIAKKEAKTLALKVHPTLVSLDNPLAEISSAFNAVYLDTEPAGELLFYGKGAGGEPTSAAVISDIVSLATDDRIPSRKEGKVFFKNIKSTKVRCYIRFMAQDYPGVLAKISRILASHNISIASVTQKERNRGKFVPIIMVTHDAWENNVRRAIAQIEKTQFIKSPAQVIRIEDL